MEPWYTTREAVKAALDIQETARRNAQVDEAIASATRTVEGYLRRVFYPTTATRYFDWPNENQRGARSWRLWVDEPAQIVSLSSLVVGGTTIASADYFLEPANTGPPYNRIEIDLSSTASFGSGDTHQRAAAATGVFGFDATTTPAGALAEALDGTETDVDVTDSLKVGVGDLLICESERMLVTEKAFMDTTVNLTAGFTTAEYNDVTGTVSSGAGLVVGETLLIDSERMLLVDVSGNTITVKRGWDGSVLDTHSTADVYAARRLTVERGATGSTAATHDTATALTKVSYPGLVSSLTKAEALTQLAQEESAYARVVGSGENEREAAGKGLEALREQARAAYGRKLRVGAI